MSVYLLILCSISCLNILSHIGPLNQHLNMLSIFPNPPSTHILFHFLLNTKSPSLLHRQLFKTFLFMQAVSSLSIVINGEPAELHPVIFIYSSHYKSIPRIAFLSSKLIDQINLTSYSTGVLQVSLTQHI